jgi:hypothetical protein
LLFAERPLSKFIGGKGMKTTKITYESYNEPPVTIELGFRRNVTREGACLDLHLERQLAIDCPLNLQILIRTDGSIAEWSAEFNSNRGNHYWHFASTTSNPITDAQRETLAKIHFGSLTPFGVRGCLGAPVCSAAFDGHPRAEIEALGGVRPGSVAYNG